MPVQTLTIGNIDDMIISADLHIHSPYSKRTDSKVDLKQFAGNAALKGLDVIGTGDCLHPKWMQEIQQLTDETNGFYEYNNIYFALTAEIESKDNIHHLLIFPDATAVTEFRKIIKPFSDNISKDGRPIITLDSVQIAEKAVDIGALIGPSHLFDSHSGLYSYYGSIHECYQYMSKEISFVELGLCSNTYMADKFYELHPYTFLTNSDTHNPHPIRLAREFTQFKIKRLTFSDLASAIKRKQGNKPILNIGIPPEEGKYFVTACKKCQMHYSYHQASTQQWKCNCGGLIKKGVNDLICKKASYHPSQHPIHRPQYVSFLPLHEIITRVYHEQNPFTEIVQRQWNRLIHTFGNEINTLLYTAEEDLLKISPPGLSEAIMAFRNATVHFHPGGGGSYGSITIPWEEPKFHLKLTD